MHSRRFQPFLYRHLKLSWTLENSLYYCYTSYKMTDQFLWFQVQINSYSSNWNTLKPDCHSWWISKMQSGCENNLEERYAIKFCFKLEKDATETYGMLQIAFRTFCLNRASVLRWNKRFRKMRGVGGVSRLVNQSWLTKGLGLGLLCWGFKEVHKEIPSEEVSTLPIGSVAFPPRQCTSQQLNPCHRLFDQDGHQDSFSASL